MIRIYEQNETEFTNNGIAVLELATDICMTHEINDEYSITFRLPPCEKTKHVKHKRIIKFGTQLFRIETINADQITAYPIYMDAARHHIQFIDDCIGETPQKIMKKIFAGTPVHIMTDAETAERGMEWVTEKTDFWAVSKLTPIGALENLMKQLETQKANCELYINNYNIALVKTIGKDNNMIIDTNKNSRGVKVGCDTNGTITRLYVYGKDDLTIGSVNNGVQYIDSPNINKFGVCEGFRQFSGTDDPEELLKLAKWQFDENNINRIDLPTYTIEADFVDIGKSEQYRDLHNVGLGDLVTVRDRKYNIEHKQRVVRVEVYPFDPSKGRRILGNPPITTQKVFSGMYLDIVKDNLKKNDKGELKTGWLECMKQNARVDINNRMQMQDIAEYETGALFTSAGAAVAIIDGKLALASSKQNGEWYWTTVIDSGQVIVNDVFTGRLNTNLVDVESDNGKLSLSGSMLRVTDAEEKTRLNLGYSNGKYVFELYAADGTTKTVYIDHDGNAVFAGKVITGEDCAVGADLIVGAVNENPVIHLRGMLSDICTISCSGIGDKETRIDSTGDLILNGDGVYIGNSNRTNRIVIQSNINDLQSTILRLTERVAALEKGGAAI